MSKSKKNIAIIGGGPAGLMAAETLGAAGYSVTIYDRMPSLGRKFLMAGRGGLNLTHSEPLNDFMERYGNAAEWLTQHINAFTPADLRAWCEGLGQETFIGSSGRIFPKVMKAAPLLRAWLKRLDSLGVKYIPNYTWQGWENDSLKFTNKTNESILIKADATLLALGGASWPRLGSDGSWVNILSAKGVDISPLRPANSGFTVLWSEHFSTKFAGSPLKPVALTHNGITHQGEALITAQGIEGSAIYAISSHLREAIIKDGSTQLFIDLKPDTSLEQLTKKLDVPRGKESFSNYLRKTTGLSAVAASLLRENKSQDELTNASALQLAKIIKSIPIRLTGTTGLARAISTAGGIKQSAIDANFMLKNIPGIFVAGEMLDWEAPTGGYLLQACFSTGVASAKGIINYLRD